MSAETIAKALGWRKAGPGARPATMREAIDQFRAAIQEARLPPLSQTAGRIASGKILDTAGGLKSKPQNVEVTNVTS